MLGGDDMGYKIGSFNVRNLGMTSLGKNNARDLQKIAEIIGKEKFDVVALQEVLSEGKAFFSHNSDFVKKSILMEAGPEWDFSWAEAKTNNTSRHEGYGFLWNKRRLRLSTTKLPDGTIRTYNPAMVKQNNIKEEMMRKPFYARFTPEGLPGGCFMEIRLICVHTYYGNDSAEDRKTRERELDILMKEVYPRISDRIYGNNMPSYTILLGDYNAELRRDWKESLKRPDPLYLKTDMRDLIEVTNWGKIKTVQDQFTTLKNNVFQSGNEERNGGYAHDYDHFSFEESRFEGIMMRARKIDAVRKYCNDDFDKYKRTVSDHVPIMMEIEI